MEAWQEILKAGGPTAVQAMLHKHGLTKRLAEAICQELDIVGTPMAQLKKVCCYCLQRVCFPLSLINACNAMLSCCNTGML